MAPVPVAIAVGIAMIITGLTLLIVLLVRLTDWKIARYAAEDRYRYAVNNPVPNFDDVEKLTIALRKRIAELEMQLHANVEPTQFVYALETKNAPPDWPTQQIPQRTWFVQHQQEIAWR